MRERIFRSVLLPAPFAPMMPTTSPTPTVKLTSFSAQNVVVSDGAPPRRFRRRNGAPTIETSDSRKFVALRDCPIAYRLLTPAIVIASDDIGKAPFNGREVAQRNDQENGRRDESGDDQLRRPRPAEHGRAEAGDHADHRIEPIEQPPVRGH